MIVKDEYIECQYKTTGVCSNVYLTEWKRFWVSEDGELTVLSGQI